MPKLVYKLVVKSVSRNAKLYFIAAVFLASAASFADQTVLQPDATAGKDAYIRADFPSSNFGSAATLFIGLTASNDKLRSLIEFNVSSVPSGDTITSAVLELYVNDSGSGSEVTAEIYALTRSWIEGEVAWDRRTSSLGWVSNGGDFEASAENSTVITSNGLYSFDVTSLVRRWHNGSLTNNGLIAKTPETAGRRGFYSSDGNPNERPKLTINHTSNAPPSISSVTDNSNATNPTAIGANVTFTAAWSDLDSTQARLFACSTSFANDSGCNQTATTFCSTSLSSSSPLSCNYTALSSDSPNVTYFAGVCDDDGNCSVSSAQEFNVNHPPGIVIDAPNGGETVNQSLGNYTITFEVNDTDNNTLTASIFYSETSGAKQNAVVSSAGLSSLCSDPDGTTATTNVCTYSWNSTNIFGTFYLDVVVNDSFQASQDSSDATFNVRSLVDTIPPNVTNVTLTANLTSGEVATATANVTENFVKNVTLEVNNSDGAIAGYSMTNASQIYSANFTAGRAGAYSFRVVAYDTSGNPNATAFAPFNVSAPNATVSKESPSAAIPSSVITIRGILNATDLLADANATLNFPAGFALLAESNRTQSVGNVSASGQKNVSWFVAAPAAEATYALNITFADQHGNIFQGASFNLSVSQAATQTGLLADINSQTEVEAGQQYKAEIFIRDTAGAFTDADNIKISLFDPLNNTVVSNVSATSHTATGKYEYVYSTSASQTQGSWLAQIVAAKSSNSAEDRQFWKLTGGPFDVRDINIADNVVPDLQITSMLENTGGAGQDLVLSWNLTRIDNGALLDSGGDTIFVGANSEKTYTIQPSTSFVGQVKISVIGTFSGTERAGAFEIFTTAAAAVSSGTGTSAAGGSSGGGGGAPAYTPTATPSGNPSLQIDAAKEISVSAGQSVIAVVRVENNGNANLSNVILNLKGMPEWFRVSPAVVRNMPPETSESFKVNVTVPVQAETGTYEFFYNATADEASAETPARLKVSSLADSLLARLEAVKTEAARLRERISLAETDVSVEKAFMQTIDEDISNAGDAIKSGRFPEAASLLDRIEEKIKEANERLDAKNVPRAREPQDYAPYIAAAALIAAYAYISRQRAAKWKNLKKKLLAGARGAAAEESAGLEKDSGNADVFESRLDKIKDMLKVSRQGRKAARRNKKTGLIKDMPKRKKT